MSTNTPTLGFRVFDTSSCLIPVTVPVTVCDSNHDQEENKKEEDAPKDNIDDGRGDGHGDRAESPHPPGAQVTFLMAGPHPTETVPRLEQLKGWMQQPLFGTANY